MKLRTEALLFALFVWFATCARGRAIRDVDRLGRHPGRRPRTVRSFLYTST